MSEGIDRSIAHTINERARARAHRDLIEWYPEEFAELKAELVEQLRHELGYRDARIHRGAPAVGATIHSKARHQALRALVAAHRLEFTLLRDAYRRELQAEAGYTDGRKSPHRRRTT